MNSRLPRAILRIVILVPIPATVLLLGCATVQAQTSKTNEASAKVQLDDEPVLQTRLSTLEAAKLSADPVAVSEAAHLVLGLAMRLFAQAELRDGSPTQAIESLQRSLDFEDAPASRLDLAVAYLAAKRLDEALSTSTDVLTADPDNAPGWYVQGRVWMAKQLYASAVTSFRHSLQLETNAECAYWLGAALLEDKQPEEAKAVFDELLQQSQNRARLHLRVADAYLDAHYPQDAARERRLALELDPHIVRQNAARQSQAEAPGIDLSLWTAYKNRSKIPDRKQRRRQYESELRKIMASALNDAGTAEARQQQFTLALSHFREAENWQPQMPGLQRNLGMAAIRAGDYKAAIESLRTVVKENPEDTVARTSLGSALFTSNAFNEAVQVLTPLGNSALEHPEVAYAWAASLIKINRYPEAEALLDKLEAMRVSPPMLLLIAQAWSQMSVYPRTVEVAHRALAADPKLLTAHSLAGLALIRQDRPAEAAQEFRDELRLDPANVEAEYNLAFVLLQQSQDAEAADLLKKVLAQNPNHPEANYELGKQFMTGGKPAEAIPYLENACRLKPSFEPAHYQLQAAYRAAGRREDADREAKIYRDLKAKSRNITLPPPREQSAASPQSQ